MKFSFMGIVVAGCVCALAGCSSSGPNGAASSGASAGAAIAPQVPAGPPPPSGVIAGPLGASLSDADRQTASDAQYDALDKNQRRSWKGKNGVFGFIELGSDSGACREYTQTVFIDGRPQSATGQACRLPNGGWKF